MIDLNHNSNAQLGPLTLCDRINAVIDASLIERRKAEPVRNYLGASQIGEECLRKLCYSYAHKPVDEGREITARTIRIFDTGHAAEDAVALQLGKDESPEDNFFKNLTARWMKDAGFTLVRTKPNGEQIGFTAVEGRFAGHTDGVIIGNPLPDEIPKPCGWEMKALNVKNWNKIKKHGVKAAAPVYYGQVQIYSAYLDLRAYLFTFLNKNTQELSHELVPYEPHAAQALSDKAVQVILSVEAGELLPRCTDNEDYFYCKWCDWKKRCWGADG
jgi:hypothetical protein